ncbi:MAG: 50S ribosomal protein L11 methyltransferase [bacterium]|nr:50S ribosomal protein L11 methyltransferase [bacterium]
MIFLEFIVGIIFFAFFTSCLLGVPFMPTHKAQTETMMDLAEIRTGKVVVDLGSGAGRLLFAAAKRGATAIGYELNPFLFIWTKLQIWRLGLGGSVQVFWKSLYQADLSKADVVVTFLFPQFMVRLDQKIFSEMKSGAKVISYVFPFKNRKEIIKKEALFLYEI